MLNDLDAEIDTRVAGTRKFPLIERGEEALAAPGIEHRKRLGQSAIGKGPAKGRRFAPVQELVLALACAQPPRFR